MTETYTKRVRARERGINKDIVEDGVIEIKTGREKEKQRQNETDTGRNKPNEAERKKHYWLKPWVSEIETEIGEKNRDIQEAKEMEMKQTETDLARETNRMQQKSETHTHTHTHTHTLTDWLRQNGPERE
jgi:hypothetical protein